VQIKLASIMLEDQEHALQVYSRTLGFEVKHDIPMSPFRYSTVASPDGVAGVEQLLEPMGFPPARTYQQALFEAGIPATACMTAEIQAGYQRLKDVSVRFRGEPKSMGPIATHMFEDTRGNLINLVQPAD